MTLMAYPQRAWCLLPDSVPRQKAYTYIFLLFLTTTFIYFYSYPIRMEHWTYIKQKIAVNTNFYSGKAIEDSNLNEYYPGTEYSSKSSDSILLQKLFFNTSRKNGLKSRLLQSTEMKVRGKYLIVTNSTKPLVASTRSPSEVENTESETNGILYTTGGKTNMTNKVHNNTVTFSNGINVRKSTDNRATTKSDDIEINKTRFHSTKQDVTTKTEVETSVAASTETIEIVHSDHYNHTTFSASTQNDFRKTSSKMKNENTTKQFVKTTAEPKIEATSTIQVTKKTFNHVISNQTSTTSSSVEKEFLVYSEQCRIPDIDPMHPSIAHLISKTPPLDCSENHKPLTRTEGHILYLNQSEVLKRTNGENYTCCYRSIFRDNEGQSDNSFGFGKKCVKISHKTEIKDEFIVVECKYKNEAFYSEFHSFIFDKPKVEKRCSKVKDDSQYSVMIIGVDAVSRLNMHRQLNATAKYLLKEMGAVEMYGFNKVGDNTFPNLIPLLLGYDERELPSVCWESNDFPLDRCNFLWKRFAKKGYRTLYAEDSPYISSFNYVKDGFYLQPTDYYFRHFMLAYEDALGRDKPLNCYLCVGSISETEAVLQWTEQFASHFDRRPRFSFSWINSGTHDFLNTGSSVDHMYERFFRTLHQTGALNKTIVILMGDHGIRWGDIRNTYVGRLEERLPMLLISLPQQFKQKYPKFSEVLEENAHRLVTPFDLHATLAHLLDLRDNWSLTNTDNIGNELSKNFTRRAISLFQPVPKDRSCDDAFIEEHWCTCESSLEVNTKNSRVKHVAAFILNHINSLLKPVSHKCSLLNLETISDARLWDPPSEHSGHSAEDTIYTVVIQTSPNEAIFEGTVKMSPRKAQGELLGTISRLNLYGNQSFCMHDAILKKYCFCL